ncbi:protein-glutamate methylesterase/protein-glutamine glutaminase [Paenibacillus nasutitermitis]|uniref:Protein-glutamate methylesterase/protein-glutamine glutaminase n=1 Tax=Paenibacillus nasutitermitis TaxID=1652958 RepID=A0A916Z4T0_9BACL|nr:chemotaxis response regulator protein-glutamate methylesterase [Paenibacillus nasutitermitis]GGD73720.1 chemotaxis response regulator protein-glutamate methylesterase [Paenibacillus nasutitermitis]
MAIKVLVVDDSAFMRSMISNYINEDDELEVIGTARNGMQAIELTKQLSPDVITLDVEMPVMNGLEALQRIMAEKPTPVLMLSSLTESGAMETIAALEQGAVDFIHKPSGSLSMDLFKVKEEIREKIKTAHSIPSRQLQIMRIKPSVTQHSPKRPVTGKKIEHIIAVGVSTGGPQALQVLLGNFPADFPHPIVIVQHMPAPFTASLANRLNQSCPLTVEEARHDSPLEGGTAYISPGDHHLNLVESSTGYRLMLHQQSRKGRHMPSVDELFTSVTTLEKLKRHFVLMTGMGNDGAEAMAVAKAAGAATTIAQSKESCVVFGMPRAAIETEAVDYVLPPAAIASKLREVTRR